MPSASTSTFMRPTASMSSLSHSMKVRSSMAAVPIGTVSSMRSPAQHEAADMLREMARKADELVGEIDRLADRRIAGVEPGLAHMLVRQAVAPVAPDRVGEGRGDVRRQAERLADLADRHARAVMDHGGADRGPLAAVAPVEILDDLLAPLMLEIDVDVRRLVALLPR